MIFKAHFQRPIQNLILTISNISCFLEFKFPLPFPFPFPKPYGKLPFPFPPPPPFFPFGGRRWNEEEKLKCKINWIDLNNHNERATIKKWNINARRYLRNVINYFWWPLLWTITPINWIHIHWLRMR